MPDASPTIRQFPLERAKILKKWLGSTIGFGTLFLLALAATTLMGNLGLLFMELALYLALAGVLWWYQTQYYEKYYYDLREDFLVIKKGVFAPRETTLPYEKLQDVYIDQDLLDRAFSLWDLHVSTATAASGWEAHIDGLNRENAERVRDLLLQRMKK